MPSFASLNVPALLSLIPLAIGGLFLWQSYRHHLKRQRLHALGHRAVGTVLRLEEGSSDEPPYHLHPVVQFVTAAGQTIIRRHSFGQYPPKYRVGQQLDIYYAPADPDSYVLGTEERGPEFWTLLILGGVFSLVGLGCLLFI